jgi:hypothetical protein
VGPRRGSLGNGMRGPAKLGDYVLLIIIALVIAYGVWMIFTGPNFVDVRHE